VVIDRGGLRYSIEVVSKNLAELKRFRSELRKTLTAQKNITREHVTAAKRASQLVRAEEQIKTARARTRRETARAAIEEAKLKAALGASRRRAIEVAIAQKRLAEAGARAAKAQLGLAGATRTGTRRLRSFNREAKKTEARANRIAFTFRRLIGIFAAFAAVRAVTRGIKDAVASGIQFNAFVEEATLGIQSLLVSAGQVFGPDGQMLTGMEAFAAAGAEATRQVELLRQEGLRTAATFKTLLDTFQIALGPGLAAGLNPDQVRKLTVRISQAASAIGLPQNQLSEEIRSILSGTIQQRTTRIAATLGITNEDIRRAKEAGKLVEFLDQKFAAFAVAGERSLSNLNVILSNLRDSFAKLVGTGTLGFFDALKERLNELKASLQGDDAQRFAESLDAGLQKLLDAFTEVAKDVGFGGLAEAFEAAVDIMASGLKLVVPLLKQAFALLDDILGVVSIVANVFSAINRVLGGALGFILRMVFLFRIVGGTLKSVVGLTRAAALQLNLMARASLRLSRRLAFAGVASKGLATSIGLGARLMRLLGIGTRLLSRGLKAALGPIGLILIGIELITDLFSSTKDEVEEVKEEANLTTLVMSDIPVVLLGTRKEAERVAKQIEKLRKESEKLRDQLEITEATSGLTGLARAVATVIEEAQDRLRREGESLRNENERNTSSLLQARATLIEMTDDAVRKLGVEKDTFEEIVSLVREAGVERGKLLQIDQRIALARSKLTVAEGREREKIQSQIQRLERQRLRLTDPGVFAVGRATSLERLDAQRKALQDQEKDAQAIFEAARARVRQENQIEALLSRQRDILTDISVLSDIIDEQLALQIANEAAKALQAGEVALQQLQLNVAAQEALAAAVDGTKLDQAEASARNAIAKTRAERDKELQHLDRNLVLLNASLATLGEGVEFEQARERLAARIAQLAEEKNLKERQYIALLALEDAKLRSILRQQREAANRPGVLEAALAGRRRDGGIVRGETQGEALEPLRRQLDALGRQRAVFEEFARAGDDVNKIASALDRAKTEGGEFLDKLAERTKKLRRELSKTSEDARILRLGLASSQGEDVARAYDQLIKLTGDKQKELFDALDLSEDAKKALASSLAKGLDLRDREKVLVQQLVELDRARGEAHGLLNDLRGQTVQQLVRELALQKQLAAEQLHAANELQAAQLAARLGGRTETEAQILFLRAQLAASQSEKDTLRSESAERVLALQRLQQRGLIEQADALGLVAAEEEARKARLQQISLKQIEIGEELRRLGDGSFTAGLRAGFEDLLRQTDEYRIGLQTAAEFADGLADALVDALNQPQEAGQIMLDFFRNLVNQIIAEFLRLQIVKVLADLFGNNEQSKGPGRLTQDAITAGITLTTAIQLAGKGLIADATAAAAILASASLGVGAYGGGLMTPFGAARGYSSGGRVGMPRPRGLHPSDTVPAWLAPGEYVHPTRAVAAYGADFMEAIRSLAIPPSLVRGLMRGVRLPAPRVPRGPGFAEGGRVPSRAPGGRGEIVIRTEEVVNDGLSRDTLRAVSPGIKRPRNVAEQKGFF